ncbi:URC4/urg3 family protein [Leptothoe sp. PORK10 BA2]|uniref:URC4/urg3 family protein n=1 Tax=Leptothoe sp. PORK10 BA2 TaxID=3110254 RepID=UPI002B20EBD0|nr:URC4/urg3 family protein [Leptothoe sp. PORK10 BA2]MEA5463189.1 URC4/urg3 family protein [Leptothoe sp. PORK10 BA2]
MTPAEQAAIAYLRQPQAIRDRTHQLFQLCQANKLEHFTCNLDRLDPVAEYVVETTQQLYPDFDVPFHSRWRHFGPARLSPPLSPRGNEGQPAVDQASAKAQLDLAMVSVLLDAGAGSQWRYQDCGTHEVLARSEGLAVASLRAFERGFFSSDTVSLHQVDAPGIQQLAIGDLVQVFQVRDDNPIVGLSGRLTLLHQLGAALASQPERFGSGAARPGNLLDYLIQRYGYTVDAGHLLTEVLESLSSIWPGRATLGGTNLGDVWSHPGLTETGPGTNLVPFHKLSQWLTYSLVEPLAVAGVTVTNLNALTGLAEYRNGGLCVDLGLLVPKHPGVTSQSHLPGSPVIVEWRALTLTMLDMIGARVQQLLNKSPEELPLIKVLEGGTWAAGRRIAKQLRPSGVPPIAIESDGTVF